MILRLASPSRLRTAEVYLAAVVGPAGACLSGLARRSWRFWHGRCVSEEPLTRSFRWILRRFALDLGWLEALLYT